jgi:hypothetical protein
MVGGDLIVNTAPFFKRTSIAAVLGFTCSAGPAIAMAAPQVGPLFTIENPMLNENGHGQFPTLAVARSANGPFVVYWRQENGTTQYNSPNIELVAQTFTADAAPAGSAFQIGKNAYGADVAMDGDGDVIAAWFQPNLPYAHSDFGYALGALSGKLVAQRYAPDGTPQGSRITVAGIASPKANWYGMRSLQVAADDDGDFKLAWTTGNYVVAPAGGNLYNFHLVGVEAGATYLKAYDNKGRLKQAARRIDETPVRFSLDFDSAFNLDVMQAFAANGKGGSVAVFDGNRNGIALGARVQRFNSASRAVTGRISLPAQTPFAPGYILPPYRVGIDASGNFAVGYSVDDGFHVALYTAKGTLLANTGPIVGRDAVNVDLAMMPSGDFVVTWGQLGQPQDFFGDGQQVSSCTQYVQYFHSNVTANGSAVVVDDGVSGGVLNGCVSGAAVDAAGNLVMVWRGERVDGSVFIGGRAVEAP